MYEILNKTKSTHPLVAYCVTRLIEKESEPGGEGFTGNPEIDAYYNIEKYPHIFVLGCLMDRQIPAKQAWSIPYKVCKHFGCFDMPGLSKISLADFTARFNKDGDKLHRFNDDMAEVFYRGVQKIHNEYNDDASLIWKGESSMGNVVKNFEAFHGVGRKISTMATNILVRRFGVEFSDLDYSAIDISPDVHVCRVFYRMGFVDSEKDIDGVIEKARELCPNFPGVLDFACWELGKKICHAANPECEKCSMNKICKNKHRHRCM